ncbi:hypothetical protein QAD02_006464 [Eretmocerus hayati]|uniref:Uncharacterized protein n=1 Tax=Eretmocerus hayati TaxID=131215 RepID=A0ACC2N127_9HYME|nr:hypothetical protein QAD02_006464 [Eretmocerus hayati]
MFKVDMNVTVLGNEHVIHGILYSKSRDMLEEDQSYWDCAHLWTEKCSAHAISSLARDRCVPALFKGPQHEPKDSHAPDQDEYAAEIAQYRMKREAERHPEQPHSQIVKDETREFIAVNFFPSTELGRY